MPRNPLNDLSHAELLNVRLCDLRVRIENSPVQSRIEKLYRELEQRNIAHRPHVWPSSEWFSPDGIPGIAVPFYLLHPRLKQLELKMMLEVEGGSERECMKILRHETGHAICTAYRLHYKKSWREVFGRFSDPYPTYYQPDPFSREFVLHFNSWYAQAHPAEDFAETFAVWLRPRSVWKKQYKNWPALEKLEYVDDLMADIAHQSPRINSKKHLDPLKSLRHTLREHYRDKRQRYADTWPDFYDRDLRKIFSDDLKYKERETAAAFLRRVQPRIRKTVSEWTGQYQYNIDQVLKDMIDRSRELKLRLTLDEEEAEFQTMLMVTVQTMNYLHGGGHQFAI